MIHSVFVIRIVTLSILLLLPHILQGHLPFLIVVPVFIFVHELLLASFILIDFLLLLILVAVYWLNLFLLLWCIFYNFLSLRLSLPLRRLLDRDILLLNLGWRGFSLSRNSNCLFLRLLPFDRSFWFWWTRLRVRVFHGFSGLIVKLTDSVDIVLTELP